MEGWTARSGGREGGQRPLTAPESHALDALHAEVLGYRERFLTRLPPEQRALFHAGAYREVLARTQKNLSPEILEQLVSKAKK